MNLWVLWVLWVPRSTSSVNAVIQSCGWESQWLGEAYFKLTPEMNSWGRMGFNRDLICV